MRKEAALALGVIAPAEAETAPLTALSDSDEDVRYFAADALGDVRTAANTGHRDAPGSGDQPGRPFRAAGRQK